MTVIVTGAAGFVGSTLAERLVQDGHDVVGIDNFHPYYSPAIKRRNVEEVRDHADTQDGHFQFVEGSILDVDALNALPDDPAYVFHQAAIAGVRNSIEQPVEYSRLNVLGTATLLKRFEDVEKFVFASSSSVYGEMPEDELPASEDREPAPIAPYPLSKVQCEQLLEMYHDLYGIPYASLRYFTVYGPRQRPDEAFTKFITKALNGDTIPIYGDGEQSRDFTHVDDVVRANLLAMDNGQGIYNIGSGRRITVNKMVQTLDDVLSGVDYEYVEQPPGDVSHTHADITKARKELGYAPEIAFEDGAESCVDWCRRMHRDGLL